MKSYRASTMRSWVKVFALVCIANVLLLRGADAACSDFVSPGDNGVGIGAFDDPTCKSGGLGCFANGACRYCKTKNTIQAGHFVACPSNTPAPATAAPMPVTVAPAPVTAAPVPVTTAPVPVTPPSPPVGACADTVSPGDKDVGISAVTDLSCKNGGLGCFAGGTCRYCKTKETVQASHFQPCSSIVVPTPAPAPITSTPVIQPPATQAPVTQAPVSQPPVTQAPVTQPPVTPAPTTLPPVTQAPVTSPSPPVGACADTVSPGDKDVGISAVTDLSCKNGGLGCFAGGTCRYCKTKETVQASHFQPCSSIVVPTPAPAPITSTPVIQPPATQAPVTQAPVSQPPVTQAPVTQPPVTPAPTTLPPVTQAPVTSAQVTRAPVTPAPTPEQPVGGSLSIVQCEETISPGDFAVGINIFTDETCSTNPGVGCFKSICRFCKTRNTDASKYFVPCPVTTAPVPSTVAPTTTVPPVATPSPVSSAPVATPPPVSSAPVTTAPPTSPSAPVYTGKYCSTTVSPGDAAVGINVITDPTCETNPTIGCFMDVCRFCKTRSTIQSQDFIDCPANAIPAGPAATAVSTTAPPAIVTTIAPPVATPPPVSSAPVTTAPPVSSAPVTTAPPPVPDAPVTTAPPTSPSAPVYTGKYCSTTVSPGDAAVGINVITDPTCETNPTIGCFMDVCRFCKTRSTIQSQDFIDCPANAIPAGPAATAVSTTAPPAIVTTPTPPVTTTPSTITTTDPTFTITPSIATTIAPPVPTTPDATATTTPPVSTTPSTATATPVDTTAAPTSAPLNGQVIAQNCTRAVSYDDSLEGIAIVNDETCDTAGDVGCIESYCRFCKLRETLASQSFLPCESFATTPVGTKTPAVNVCSGSIEPSQALSGIWMNVACQEWFHGTCLQSMCSPCKFADTTVSASLPACVTPPTAPAVPTALPFAPESNMCTEAILSEIQPSFGIWTAWDDTCSSNQLDCVSKCRFCKYAETPQSSALTSCNALEPLAPLPTFAAPPVGVMRPSPPPTNECSDTLTATEINAGIWQNVQCYATDAAGACTSVVCSPCSYFDTETSFRYPECVNGIFPYWSDPLLVPVLVHSEASAHNSSTLRSDSSVSTEKLTAFQSALAVAAAVGVVTLFVAAAYHAKRAIRGTTGSTMDRTSTGTPSILSILTSDDDDDMRGPPETPMPSMRPRKARAPRTPVMA